MWLGILLKRFHVFFAMIVYGEKFVDVKIRYYIEYATYLGKRGAVDRALHYCNKALELDTDNFYALLGLVTAFVQKKEFDIALQYGNRALSSETKNVPGYSRETLDLLLAVIYEISGSSGFVEETMNRLTARCDGDLASVHAQLGRIYFDLGIYRKAEDHYEEVMKMYPTDSAPYYNLARVYLARQTLMTALEFAEDRRKKRAILRQLSTLGI